MLTTLGYHKTRLGLMHAVTVAIVRLLNAALAPAKGIMAVLLAFSALTSRCDELQELQWKGTTEAYKKAAIGVLLAEVNQIAGELELPENLPIKESDLVETWIRPPFWTIVGEFGFVATSNYYYYATLENKLASIVPNFGRDDVNRPAYMESLRKRYLRPKAQMDTNGAYRLATQWLARAGLDVRALERDAERIAVDTWEIGARFVPIYIVRWEAPRSNSIACVWVVVPERRVLQVDVHRSNYIKRKPLVVPNRDELLQRADDPKLRELWFTTEAYKAAAYKVMLKEVNWAAQALGLPEKLPIESALLEKIDIGTPFAADRGQFASLSTKGYCYGAGQKLWYIARLHGSRKGGEEDLYYENMRKKYTIPWSAVNTNKAYLLATQWLAALSVDLKRLHTDYPYTVTVLDSWGLKNATVPLYRVEWSKPIERRSVRDTAVTVELLEPERALELLTIEKPEYLARPPLVVPERERLLKK